MKPKANLVRYSSTYLSTGCSTGFAPNSQNFSWIPYASVFSKHFPKSSCLCIILFKLTLLSDINLKSEWLSCVQIQTSEWWELKERCTFGLCKVLKKQKDRSKNIERTVNWYLLLVDMKGKGRNHWWPQNFGLGMHVDCRAFTEIKKISVLPISWVWATHSQHVHELFCKTKTKPKS
jgi:hypothetical protein